MMAVMMGVTMMAAVHDVEVCDLLVIEELDN